MNLKEKGKIQEAIKLFDNKEFKSCKKQCEKILEKQPKNEDALALKGLSSYFLGDKEEGRQMISDALKINMKSAFSWHFMAMLHKEEGNYSKALSAYLMAYKNNPANYNVIRDLSYLQIYLRQYNAFSKYSKIALDTRPDLLVNWLTYAFASALNENYPHAKLVLESSKSMVQMRPCELTEIALFQALMLTKQKKYKEAVDFLLEKKNEVIDKTLLYEGIVKNASIVIETTVDCNTMREIARDYLDQLLKINSENVNYFIWYFNIECEGLLASSYDDLLSIQSDSQYLSVLYDLLKKLQLKYKSRILNRLELAFAMGDDFKEAFKSYFIKNVLTNLPSFFKNIKFIYCFQPFKVKLIEEFLTMHLDTLDSSSKMTIDNTVYDSVPNIIWVYYYAAQHYDYEGNLEKAMLYINKAINLTPSVLEFYMCKSKLFKHGLMFKESCEAYSKARSLDYGDLYLNVKYAKTYARVADVKESNEIMRQFIKDYFTEENIEYYQYMWYENEIAAAYLQNGQILHSHWLYKNLLKHFTVMYDDQIDFFNYALRRYMINDIYSTMTFLDNITKNKFIFKSMIMLEEILCYLKQTDESKDKELMKEFEVIKTENCPKYTYTTKKDLIEDIEKDLYQLCLKVSQVSNDPQIQFICLKVFIIKHKTVLAFKALNFLVKNKMSYYYIEGVRLFGDYYAVECEKVDGRIRGIIVEHIMGKEINDKYKTWNDDKNEAQKIMRLLKQKGKYCNRKDNEEMIMKIADIDRMTMRKITNEFYHEMFGMITLYSDVECKENLKAKMRDVMKIEMTDAEIHDNLTFYDVFEDKTQAEPKEEEKKDN